MSKDLEENLKNIKEQSLVVMEAIEALKQKQYSLKPLQFVGWVIVILVVIISIAYACQVNR